MFHSAMSLKNYVYGHEAANPVGISFQGHT